MRKILLTVSLAASLVAGAAYAGQVAEVAVEVDTEFGTAIGDQITARYSDNDVEMIGCGIRYIEDGSGGILKFAFCQATDAEEINVFCSSLNAELIDAVNAASSYAFITFSWDTDTLECTRIGFSTQSFYIPDNVDKGKKD